MFAVRNLRQFFNVRRNHSDVLARSCCTSSVTNDFKIQSGIFQNAVVFPRIQAHITISHKFSTQGLLFLKKHDQANSGTKYKEGFIPLTDFYDEDEFIPLTDFYEKNNENLDEDECHDEKTVLCD